MTVRGMHRLFGLTGLLAVALVAACTGDIGETEIPGPTGGASPPAPGGTPTPGGPSKPGGPANPGTAPGSPEGASTADFPVATPSPVVRMLSRRELGNAIEALVGFRPAALGDLPADKHDLVYDRVVEAQTVSSLHEDAFESIANQIADGLLAKDLGAVVPACAPKAALPAD